MSNFSCRKASSFLGPNVVCVGTRLVKNTAEVKIRSVFVLKHKVQHSHLSTIFVHNYNYYNTNYSITLLGEFKLIWLITMNE